MKVNEASIRTIAETCIMQGCSPEYLLGLTKDNAGIPAFSVSHLDEKLRCFETERLPEAIQAVMPEAQFSKQLANMIDRLLKSKSEEMFGLAGHDLISFWRWGFSLSWLLFGVGNRNNYRLCIPQEAIKSSQVGPEDREFVRLKYGWDTSDSLWFFGAAAPHRKNSAVSRVLIRLLAAFPVTQILPEPEDIMSTYHRLQQIILSTELNASAEPWMKNAIQQMQKKPHKVRLLLLANQAQFSFWKLENRMPTAGTLKLVYILERQLNRYGASALLEYLKILHAEAICQGFSGFDQVVSEGAWKREKRQKTS